MGPILGVTLGMLGLPTGVRAQSGPNGSVDVAHEVFAGSDLEGYVRALQNVGMIGPHPWSLRGFSASEIRRAAAGRPFGPWDERYGVTSPGSDPRSGPALQFGWTTPRATGLFNSGFPYGGNDGPRWAGRGLTTELQLGAYARFGSLSVVVHPVLFRAENEDFDLAPTGFGGQGVYRSPVDPSTMDVPQRFGSTPYSRVDPGYSTVRLDGLGMTAGVSTAAQHWGPTHLHPLVMGPAAGGFPHFFLGTDGPRNIGIGRLHARYMAGRTEQSAYFGDRRFGLVTALVVVFEPKGLSGLEVGGIRYFKMPWDSPEARSDQLLRLFEGFLKGKLQGVDERRDEQFASVFARWNIPEAGVEVFGEYVRVDHSYNLRVFLLEPDDQAGYALGMRRVWTGADGSLTTLRGEVITSGATHRERGGARVSQAYRARTIFRGLGGHTHHGQLLATVAGPFGNGQTLGLDRYTDEGRWSVELDRRVVRDRTNGARPPAPADMDVTLALGGEVVRFHDRWELRAGITGVWELNRHLRPDDAFNLGLSLGAGYLMP